MDKLWEKHYTAEVPGSLSYPAAPIDHFLRESARSFPDRTALIFEGSRISYRSLDAQVDGCAAGLHRLGVRKGDRVALLLPNCPHAVISFYSIFRLGAIAVPINPLYQEREIAKQIDDAGARILITLDLFSASAQAVMGRSPGNICVIGAEKMVYPLFKPKEGGAARHERSCETVAFRDLMLQQAPPATEIAPGDIAILQYTGGTTGISKGAELTHGNIVSNTAQMAAWYYIIRRGEEVFLSVLPLFHTYGIAVCMNLSLATAGTMLLIPRFAPREVLKAIKEYGVTFFPGIPGIYAALNNYRDIEKWDLSSVRYCVSGSAPLPVPVLKDFERRTGGMILEGYGLTEASPVTHSNPVHRERKAGSIGLPLADTDCKIVDLTDGTREVPVGEAGELCIKGPQVMKGYWRSPEETSRTLKDGWLYTGDIARIDADGYFYIMERKKDMIISEGFNVYPNEIDEVVLAHPDVADAGTVGVPDSLRGEKVVLFVVIKEGKRLSQDQLLAYCRERLAKYKLPKKVIFKSELPRTAVGKVLRRSLRDEAMQSTNTDRPE
ncbi:MAG: fadD5 [Deltaproteobacteria bacterium]|nr:fadD5 [Deltaproteobacteria bacterium]